MNNKKKKFVNMRRTNKNKTDIKNYSDIVTNAIPILNKYIWKLPPCKNRQGVTRHDYDKKTIIHVKTDLVSLEHPVIMISDLHYHTPIIFPKLAEYIDLSKCIVLTVGDMAGDLNVFGCDGDPTNEYKFMAERAKEFYFVQGNHDLPTTLTIDNIDNITHKDIKNNQDKNAFIENGKTINSLVGQISGVNGIISDRRHPYKLPYRKYLDFIKQGLEKKPDILMTHDTPKINDGLSFFRKGEGQEYLFSLVDKYKPKIHLYGHCHHWDWHTYINGVNYICADARIIIFEPSKVNSNDYLLKDLADEDFITN